MPKVSVIIPVFNVERYLRECLDSVTNQTLRDIEIICVDDGSTDGSARILAEYASRDPRTKVISKANSGYGQTMNVGLDGATGEYIGIVESDDFVKSDMYEMLYNIAIQHDVDVLKADYLRFARRNGKLDTVYNSLTGYRKEYNRKELSPQEHMELFGFAINTWSGVYRRAFLESNHIRHNETPGASYQDAGFWFQTLCLASRVYFLDQAFYMYRSDNPNSSVNDRRKVFAVCEEYAFISQFLKHNPQLESKFIHGYSLARFHSYLWNYNRIADEYRMVFLERFSLEFKQALADGELSDSLFTRNELKTLRSIVADPDAYYRHGRGKQPVSSRSEQSPLSLSNRAAAFFRYWEDYGPKYAVHAATHEIRAYLRMKLRK